MGLDKVLAPLAVSLLLVSGCSTQSKPDYDPIESIEYEKCLDAYIEASELSQYRKFELAKIIEFAIEECKRFKPTKQG